VFKLFILFISVIICYAVWIFKISVNVICCFRCWVLFYWSDLSSHSFLPNSPMGSAAFETRWGLPNPFCLLVTEFLFTVHIVYKNYLQGISNVRLRVAVSVYLEINLDDHPKGIKPLGCLQDRCHGHWLWLAFTAPYKSSFKLVHCSVAEAVPVYDHPGGGSIFSRPTTNSIGACVPVHFSMTCCGQCTRVVHFLSQMLRWK